MNNIKTETLSSDFFNIDPEIYSMVLNTYGTYYETISKIDKNKLTNDVLNPNRSLDQAKILINFIPLENKKVLEIGSGFGMNLVVWTKKYNIDGYGIEPDSEGFQASYKISKRLLKLNNLDENKIINATGEKIPFPDNEFDIIYSLNVLEHVQAPAKVLTEAIRVLKPGGIMQFVYPNHHSYFEGHYAVFHPPIFSKWFLPWYIKWIVRRSPEYAGTIRTELNVNWTKKFLNDLKNIYNFEIITLGEDIFIDRLNNFNYSNYAGLHKLGPIMKIIKALKINKLLTGIILSFKSWTPIVLTLRKL